MIPKKENGEYVFRQFFPETMQLTKIMTGKDKKFKKLYGEYKEWFDNGEPMSIGNVINNERDGLWALYNHDDGVLRSALCLKMD